MDQRALVGPEGLQCGIAGPRIQRIAYAPRLRSFGRVSSPSSLAAACRAGAGSGSRGSGGMASRCPASWHRRSAYRSPPITATAAAAAPLLAPPPAPPNMYMRIAHALAWAAAGAALYAMVSSLLSTSAAAAVSAPSGVAAALPSPLAALSATASSPSTLSHPAAVAIRSAWAGLAAGCLHTLAGADHLAALTPLTIGRSHLRASLLGALWGFGHSTGQLILGLAMVLLKDRFTALVPALSRWGGTTVGLTLLAIGALGIYESYFEEDHEHAHAHGEVAAVDAFVSSVEGGEGVAAAMSVTPAPSAERRGGFGHLATFATGIVYGLQPDALFVIVPALALPTKLAAVAYIFAFVFGTVAAMGAYTGVIGATSAAIKKTNSRLTKNLSGVAAAAAIAIGIGILTSAWFGASAV